MKNRSKIPFLLIGGGLVLIVGALAWLLFSANTTSFTETGPEFVTVRGPHPDIPRVSLEDAKEAFNNGDAVFLDVRGDDAYAISHIPGAISISENDLVNRFNELSPSDWIITYCT